MFEVNVFGLMRMTQALLPGMRRLHKGCIVNISSLGGIRGVPSLGQYCATKLGVEGLSEALRQEVTSLGILVMVVESRGFRTNWAGRSANESAIQIDDYVASTGSVRTAVRLSSRKQPGDPMRAAKAIMLALQAGEAMARAADFPLQKAAAAV
jgi:short-subunit dehydrogenase